jgi:hypothetical protein
VAAGILADGRAIPIELPGNGAQGLAGGDPFWNPGPETLPALGDCGRRRAGRAGRLDRSRGGALRADPVLGEDPLQDLPPMLQPGKAVGDRQRRGAPATIARANRSSRSRVTRRIVG